MVARLGRSCLSKTIDLMRFIKREEPDTPVKAYLALCGFGVVLQLQALDGPECGADRIELSRTRLLVTINALQFGGEIAQQIEAFVELVTNEQGHVDSFFSCVLSFVECGSF